MYLITIDLEYYKAYCVAKGIDESEVYSECDRSTLMDNMRLANTKVNGELQNYGCCSCLLFDEVQVECIKQAIAQYTYDLTENAFLDEDGNVLNGDLVAYSHAYMTLRECGALAQ